MKDSAQQIHPAGCKYYLSFLPLELIFTLLLNPNCFSVRDE